MKNILLALTVAGLLSLGAAHATTPAPVAKTPAPGKWEIAPHVLVEGTETPLEIRYEHTGEAFKPGDGICLSMEKISVASLFHLPMSEAIELAPWKGALPKINLNPGNVNGVGYREVTFTFPEGLKKGDSFKLIFGNKKPDGTIVALVTPLPMTNFGLPTWTIPANTKARARWIDWFDAGWNDAVAHCDIVPDKAKEVLIYLPSLVKCGQPFFMRASVTDGLDSRPEPVWSGKLDVIKNADIKNLPAAVEFSGDDKCYKVVRNLSIDKEGVYRVRVKGPDGKWYESNPVVVRKEIGAPIYWGNLHNHGQYSEGTAMSNEWFYETARTVTGMDYASLSDHMAAVPTDRAADKGRLYKWRNGHIMTPYDAWKNTIDVADSPTSGVRGEFVTLLGYENGCKDGGHYNVYYADASMENMDAMFPVNQSQYVQEIRAPMLSPAAKGKDVLAFPHCHAANFDWTLIEERTLNGAGKRLTPVVEVYSDWGNIFPFFDAKLVDTKFGGPRNASTKNVLWAWSKGLKFGAVGDADSHTGLPGRIHIVGSSALEHDHPVGMTAARTNDFTRQGIMNAYQNMAVYATTGDRIFLDFTLSGKAMGEDLATDKPIEAFLQLAGVEKFANAKLYRGVELLKEFKLNSRDTVLRFTLDAPASTDEKAYVVCATQRDGAMAMGTPIWVRKYSCPDLAWENKDGKLFLVNKGTTEATNVTVAYSKDSYAVAAPSITGAVPSESVDYSFIWTERRDDQTVFFHHRWKGKAVNAQVLFNGVTCDLGNNPRQSDDVFLTTGFSSSGSTMKKTDSGMELELKPAKVERFNPGYDLIFKVSGTEPAYVELRFDRPVDSYMWGKPTTTSVVRVPLNGLGGKDEPKETVIKKIAPGEKIEMDKKLGYKGYWVADPANRIAESNEMNNLAEIK